MLFALLNVLLRLIQIISGGFLPINEHDIFARSIPLPLLSTAHIKSSAERKLPSLRFLLVFYNGIWESKLNDIDNEIEEWQNEKNENYIELDYAEKENIFESDDKVFDALNQEEENSENFYAFENDDELNKISENERSYLDKYLY